jgi:hypothetical protein
MRFEESAAQIVHPADSKEKSLRSCPRLSGAAPSRKVHRQKKNSVRLANVEDAANVRMGNLAGVADLGMQTRERCGVPGQLFGKKLHGDDLAEPQIFGAVNLAHAAATGQRYNPITLP